MNPQCASYPWYRRPLVNIISGTMGQVGSLLALLSLYFFLAAFFSDSEWLLGTGKTQYHHVAEIRPLKEAV